MATISVKVCDKCESTECITEWFLQRASKRVTVDLCETCGEALEGFLLLGSERPPKAKTQKARKPRPNVVSMDQVEALRIKAE